MAKAEINYGAMNESIIGAVKLSENAVDKEINRVFNSIKELLLKVDSIRKS